MAKKIPFISTLKADDHIKLADNIELYVEFAPNEEFDSYRLDVEFIDTGAIYQFDTDCCSKRLLGIINQGEEAAKKNLVKFFTGK